MSSLSNPFGLIGRRAPKGQEIPFRAEKGAFGNRPGTGKWQLFLVRPNGIGYERAPAALKK